MPVGSRRAAGDRSTALDEKRLFWRRTGEQRPSDQAGTALAFEVRAHLDARRSEAPGPLDHELERLLRRDPG
jgi:hypothetical protein